MKTVAYMLVVAFLLVGGCFSSRGKSSYRAGYDFSTIDKVAIIAIEGAVTNEPARDQIADFFGMELLENGYAPMGRAQVRALLAEQELESTDLTTAEGAAEVGRILGVPAVFIVSIPHFTEEISITAKMIDVEDGSFLWMGSASGKSGRDVSGAFGFVPGVGSGAAVGGPGDETFGEVMGEVFGGDTGERALSPKEAEKIQRIVRKICRSLPPRPTEEW